MKSLMTRLDTLLAAAAMAEGGMPESAREMLEQIPPAAKPQPASPLTTRERPIRPPTSPAAQPAH